MNTFSLRQFLFASIVLLPSTALGQIVAQHLGANDPESQGFYRSEFGSPQLGPVFGDSGFDAWSFDSTGGNGGLYNYQLSPGQMQAAAVHGWELSVRMRIVTPGRGGFFAFGAGIESFRVNLDLNENGDILVLDGPNIVHTFVGGSGYHEYSLIYDAIEETAALWIAGVGHVADTTGRGALPEGRVRFGMHGSGHTHWNEVTLTIIPEPAAAALLAGAVALLAVGILRRRGRMGSFQT